MYGIIFEWHLKVGEEQAFCNEWKTGSDVIQTYPGARGTKLFRSVDKPGTFFAIAEWDSKEARDAAFGEIKKRPDAHQVLRGHEKFVDYDEVIARLEFIAESP